MRRRASSSSWRRGRLDCSHATLLCGLVREPEWVCGLTRRCSRCPFLPARPWRRGRPAPPSPRARLDQISLALLETRLAISPSLAQTLSFFLSSPPQHLELVGPLGLEACAALALARREHECAESETNGLETALQHPRAPTAASRRLVQAIVAAAPVERGRRRACARPKAAVEVPSRASRRRAAAVLVAVQARGGDERVEEEREGEVVGGRGREGEGARARRGDGPRGGAGGRGGDEVGHGSM